MTDNGLFFFLSLRSPSPELLPGALKRHVEKAVI